MLVVLGVALAGGGLLPAVRTRSCRFGNDGSQARPVLEEWRSSVEDRDYGNVNVYLDGYSRLLRVPAEY